MVADPDLSEHSTSRRQTLKLLGLGALLPLASTAPPGSSTVVSADDTSGPGSTPRTHLDDVIVAEETTRDLGPGVDLTEFSHLDADGWVAGHVLDLDFSATDVSTDRLTPGLTDLETVSNMVDGADATCGVNGDFYDSGNTNAPLGAELANGTIDKSSDHIVETTYVVDDDGLGHILDVLLDGSVFLPNGEFLLETINATDQPIDSIGAFTHAWGDTTRLHSLAGAAVVTEVTVRDGEVVSVSHTPDGEGPVGPDEIVLVGREEKAATLAELSPGDPVSVEYTPATELDARLDHGLGGNVPLVTNGEPNAGLSNTGAAPRTAVGVMGGGKSVFILTVDGRQETSRGLAYPRLAEYMIALGAEDALNLDGGGSTTMVARERGREPTVQNNPSDGAERRVSNGLGVFLGDGTGQLTGFVIEANRDDDDPPRLFPGLTRNFVAFAEDEMGDPVDVEPSKWHVTPGSLASVDADGVVTGEAPGEVRIKVTGNDETGELDARVLTELVQVVPTRREITFSGRGEQTTFAVWGRDRDGRRAPIEHHDVTVTYDEDVVSVDRIDDGQFEVTSETDSGRTTIETRVAQTRYAIPVAVSTEEESVDPIKPEDRLILQNAALADDQTNFRIAVLAGGGISSTSDGQSEDLARRALGEVARAEPDRLLIGGNFVERGTEANYRKAMDMIDEKIGDAFPVHYAPGVRERRDDSDLENFEAIVGKPRATFHHEGTRFVALDSSTGSFRTADFEQLLDVEGDVEDAAEEAADDWTEGYALENQRDGIVEFSTLGEFGEHRNQDFAIVYTIESTDQSRDAGVMSSEDDGWDSLAIYYNSGFFRLEQSVGMTIRTSERTETAVATQENGLLDSGRHRVVINKITNDSRNWEIYIDGEAVPTRTPANAGEDIPPMGGSLRLFEDAWSDGRELHGSLDNVKIFDRALDGDDIVQDYDTQPWSADPDDEELVGVEDGLIHHWPMGEGGGETIADVVGGEDGTIRGDLKWIDIDRLVVLAHHAVTDPFSADADLDDELEADFFASRLAKGARESATDVAYLSGRAHTASVDRFDEVSHVTAGTIDAEIEPVREAEDARTWVELGGGVGTDASLRADVRPLLSGITLDVADSMVVGDTAAVSAVGHQDEGPDVPLDYPLTVRWSGSENLFVGSGDAAEQARESGDYDAIFNPETRELEALAAGTVTIRVSSNDVTAAVEVELVES